MGVRLTPEANSIQASLKSLNRNPVYRQDQFTKIAERLLKSEGTYWKYYSREDVTGLLDGN
jgi:hypothetical protein